MPNLSITNTFVDGTVASASDVNTNFTDIETFVNSAFVDDTKIAAGGLTGASIADNSVDGDKIADNSIDLVKLSFAPGGAVGPDDITDVELRDAASDIDDTDRAVTSDHIRLDAVTTSKIADGAVTPSKLSVPGISSLPGSPVDGQVEWIEIVDGVTWGFRYNAGSALALKWEFIGGPPMGDFSTVGGSTSSASFGTVGTSPTITIPVEGEYTINHGAQIYFATLPASGSIRHGRQTIAVNGSAFGYNDYSCGPFANSGGGKGGGNSATAYDIYLFAGDIVTVQYALTGGDGTINIDNHWVSVIPSRAI